MELGNTLSTENLIIPSLGLGAAAGAIGGALLNIEPVTGAVFGAVHSAVSLLTPCGNLNSADIVQIALRFFSGTLAGLGVALAIGGKITFTAALCLSLIISAAQILAVYSLFVALCNCRIRFG